MRSRLKNGRLVDLPRNLLEAELRVQQLDHEVDQIKSQLKDPQRLVLNFSGDVAAYETWKTSAGNALKVFGSESHKTTQWIHRKTARLLQVAYKLLVKLEAEVDFDDDEELVMEKLDNFYEKWIDNNHTSRKQETP